jgi:hypothetical protein
MALKFVEKNGLYNPHTNNVKFFGEDDGNKVMFAVSREKLAELEDVKALDERGAVKAFARHRNRLWAVAEKVYLDVGPGSEHAYELTAKYFDAATGDDGATDTEAPAISAA